MRKWFLGAIASLLVTPAIAENPSVTNVRRLGGDQLACLQLADIFLKQANLNERREITDRSVYGANGDYGAVIRCHQITENKVPTNNITVLFFVIHGPDSSILDRVAVDIDTAVDQWNTLYNKRK